MQYANKKYIPFQPVKMTNREWPDKVITKAPVWCSVDLRDGNQALVTPMQLDEKLLMFKTLVDIGFKEIEVGFPSASDTEYEILRTLIEGNYIPDDVTVQVLVQARAELIKKTFEAVKGAKNVIIHFYNSTSTLQRKVVFKKDMDGIVDIAVEGARLIRKLTEEEVAKSGMNIRYEYSPESFTGTEIDFSIRICEEVMREHYEGHIGLVPLTSTMHMAVHSGAIKIPTSKIYGNWLAFMNKYGDYLDKDMKSKIDDLLLLTDDEIEENNATKLQKNISDYKIKYTTNIDGGE